MPSPNFYAMAARLAACLPPEWQPRHYQSCGPIGVELVGAEPIGTYKHGPRKGQPKFPPEREWRSVFVSKEQIEQTKAAWQQETGLCARCGGDGQIIAGIYSTHTTYRACDVCNGTGRAVAT
jgi:hypothetical protein